jgi:hypothetical protein
VGRVLVEQDESAIRLQHDVKPPDDPDNPQRNVEERDGSGRSEVWARMPDPGCRMPETKWRERALKLEASRRREIRYPVSGIRHPPQASSQTTAPLGQRVEAGLELM